MKLLLDTNIFIEAIFKQPQAVEAKMLLANASHELFISIFSLHSIGIILLRRGRAKRWPSFIRDMLLSGRVKVLSLSDVELASVLDVAQSFSLDFDDAYQYVVAEAYDLTLVSFDSDFDRTPRGRQHSRTINQTAS